jgi:hypothetical protein
MGIKYGKNDIKRSAPRKRTSLLIKGRLIIWTSVQLKNSQKNISNTKQKNKIPGLGTEGLKNTEHGSEKKIIIF